MKSSRRFALISVLTLASLSVPLVHPSLSLAAPEAKKSAKSVKPIEVWVKEGCQFCTRAKAFLKDLKKENPELVIVEKDLAKEPKLRDEMKKLAGAHGLERLQVPLFHIDGKLYVGFESAETTGNTIREMAGLKAEPTLQLPF